MRQLLKPARVLALLIAVTLIGAEPLSSGGANFVGGTAQAAPPKGKTAKKGKGKSKKASRKKIRAALKHLSAARKNVAKASSIPQGPRSSITGQINSAGGMLRSF